MDNQNSKHYIDPGTPLWQYTDRVFCRCPKCDQKAIISTTTEHIRISCLSCTYQENRSADKLYNDVVGKARELCPTCGYQWLEANIKAKATSQLKKTTSIDCPGCKQQAIIKLHWENDQDELYGNSPIDPFFGFPLWLQIECCNNVLWVYNEKHLADLQAYVAAKIRYRANRGKWSMITRLPQWIISAKNRETILKCLEKIERIIPD
jgi:transposase-like protein